MDVLATGYPSLDHIAQVSHSPAVGATALLRSIPDTFSFGGCGANVAVGLARMGHRAGCAMVVGDDPEGREYIRYLGQLGVNVDNVVQMAGQQTSRSYLFLNPDGQYQNFFFPGAADAWRDELALHGIDQYRFALVTVGALHYNRQFARCVRQAGVPLVWALKADIHAYPPGLLGEFLTASAYVVMNHIEADYVIQALGKESIVQCLSDTTRAIIVTRGQQGSQVYTAAGMTAIAAVPPRVMLDPTGAGDGFTAGFLAGLLRGATPEIGAQVGAVVASFVLEAVGCQTNLPGWEQTMARHREHFGPFEGNQ